jgi:hypothetical protein
MKQMKLNFNLIKTQTFFSSFLRLYLKAFLIKIRKNVQKKMYNKFLTQTFRHSFFELYCGLTYQFVFEECFIKSNTITSNYSLCIAFIEIKMKSSICYTFPFGHFYVFLSKKSLHLFLNLM